MSENENDDDVDFAQHLDANLRPWNGYWAWKDKPTGETGAAADILRGAGIHAEALVSRGDEDPPDCEAWVEGHLTGIEVTELVHQKTLERSLKALKLRAQGKEPDKAEAYFVWDRDDLLGALQDRIDSKDQAKLKGGPYERYILVVCTDEMFLSAPQVELWLAGAKFRADRITDVLLGLSYDPAQQCCPVFKLCLVGSVYEG